MSYRTRVNGVQIFGNNEYCKEWVEFLQSKGVEVDEDGCYDGEIDDVMGMFEVIDKITKRLIRERHEEVERGVFIYELTDFSKSYFLDDETSRWAFNKHIIKNGYCFLPYQVYKAVEDVIENTDEQYKKDGVDWCFYTYKLKSGEKIRVHAG